MKNYYQVLGVSQSASLEEIKKKYRELARRYHPDKDGGSEVRFKEINEAYAVLIDSFKKADFDQNFKDSAEPKTAKSSKQNAEPTTFDYLAAISRAILTILAGALGGFIFEFILFSLNRGQAFKVTLFYPGIFWGVLLGIFLGIDLNFKVEGFLESIFLKRVFSFLRIFIYALSFSYFLGKIFLFISPFLKIKWLTEAGIILGLLLGAAFGSDSEGVEKLKTLNGRFEILKASLKAAEIGLLGMVCGIALGFLVQFLTAMPVVFWGGFFGFSLGVILNRQIGFKSQIKDS